MSLELTFLGTGTSAGVPMIGCGCDVCRSDDPRDRRSRSSVLVRYPDEAMQHDEAAELFNPKQVGQRQVLIDASPELRQQALDACISRLDAVMFTHAHADHIFGLDDLRRFNAVMQSPLDIFAEASVVEQLREMFYYVFEPHRNVNASWVAQLIAFEVKAGEAKAIHGATWTPIRLMHGRLPILGYRVDHGDASIAYCTDVSTIPPESYPLLEGLDVLVLDGLRPRHHPTHMTIDQAVEVIQQVNPKRAYLTHIAHDVSHAELDGMLPEGIEPAHDGLVVSIQE